MQVSVHVDVASGAVCAASNPAGGTRRLPGHQAADLAIPRYKPQAGLRGQVIPDLLVLPVGDLRGRRLPCDLQHSQRSGVRPVGPPEPSSPPARCRSARPRQRTARPCGLPSVARTATLFLP
jgi:hypothetical protein